MPHLGLVADTISEDFARAAALASDWGISRIELYHLWHKNVCDLDDGEVERALALVRAHGLTVTNIASLVFRCAPTDEAAQREVAVFERAVTLARRFGTDRVRCYAYLKQPNLAAVWPRILRTYETLVDLAERHGVTMLFENSSYANVQTAVELRRFLDAVVHPRLKLLWDAGNAFALGDPTPTVEAWHMLKDRIAHLHLKDSTAHGTNHWVPVGAGAFPLEGLLRALAADGYRGGISLEPYFGEASDPVRERKVQESVEGCRRAAAKAGLDLSGRK